MASRRSQINNVILRNERDENGEWIEMHISLGSWVTMRPRQTGGFAVKKRRLNDVLSHWKAQVIGFVLSPAGKSVDEIVIAHAYGPLDLLKEEIAKKPQFPRMEVNCICSSDFKDRVPAQSITSVLEVHHFSIGQLLYPDLTTSALRDNGVWFHKYHYSKAHEKGKLTVIDAPNLNLLSKGFFDLQMLTAYRRFLAREIERMLTERGGVRCGVKAFLPLQVFAFLFRDVKTLKIAPQTYTLQILTDNELDIVFFGDWKSKIHETGGQLTECAVDTKSLIFRYRLPKQMLYCNFFVQRRKQFKENGNWCWKPVEEHCLRSPTIQLQVHIEEARLETIDVEEDWTLMECRKLLECLCGLADFQFIKDSKKVGLRRECSIKCKDCMSPHVLRVVSQG